MKTIVLTGCAMDRTGSKGFDKSYWDENYSDPTSMDGIGNAKKHVLYMKYLFELDFIDINSIVDFGFGLGALFREVVKEFKPYKVLGIEPSHYAYNKVRDMKVSPIKSTKIKLEKTDLKSWCESNKGVKKRFDLGICTSVFQYLTDEEIEFVLPIMASKVKYLYFSVPTNKELDRQIDEIKFRDTYAIRRSRTKYQKMLKKYFTFVSSRLLESKIHFNQETTSFTDLLFRF